MQITIYGIYVFLAVFLAGNMTTLQIQHYGIYPYVGEEYFKEYIQANNKSAFVPSVLPALMLLLVNFVLIFMRPAFMSLGEVILSLALNIAALISTFLWQRKLQGEMAVSGYDQIKIKLLLLTNWIRTVVFLIQAIFAVSMTINAVRL